MEPTTAVAAVKTIIGVIQSLKEIEQGNAFSRWQDDVSGKLDSVLHNTDLIIADLKQLRIDFRDDLKNSFRAEYINRLQGEVLNLSAILANVSDGVELNQATKDRLGAAVERIRTLMYSTLTYGFSTLPLALTGLSILYPTMRMANFSNEEILFTRGQLNQTILMPALDEGKIGSYVNSLKQTRDQISSYKNRINLMIGDVTLGIGCINRRYIGGSFPAYFPYIVDIEQYTTSISGIVDDPESFRSGVLLSQIIQRDVPEFGPLMYIQNIIPPIDESGAMAFSQPQATALRDDLLLKAKAVSRDLLAEIENEAKLGEIITYIKLAL